MTYLVESDAERSRALAYVDRSLSGSLIYDSLAPDVLRNEFGILEIACAPDLLIGHNYCTGWVSESSFKSREWLIEQIGRHLAGGQDKIFLVEDMCGRPGDLNLRAGGAGPLWQYRDRLLWPITPSMNSPANITKSLNWGLIGHIDLLVACRAPNEIHDLSRDQDLDEAAIGDLACSTTTLIVGAFDGDGYMKFTRN